MHTMRRPRLIDPSDTFRSQRIVTLIIGGVLIWLFFRASWGWWSVFLLLLPGALFAYIGLDGDMTPRPGRAAAPKNSPRMGSVASSTSSTAAYEEHMGWQPEQPCVSGPHDWSGRTCTKCGFQAPLPHEHSYPGECVNQDHLVEYGEVERWCETCQKVAEFALIRTAWGMTNHHYEELCLTHDESFVWCPKCGRKRVTITVTPDYGPDRTQCRVCGTKLASGTY